jgi:hypothetical protein
MDELKAKLKPRIPNQDGVGCFLCKWIHEDLEKNGKLTDVHPPKNIDGSTLFPADGKKRHLVLEGFWGKQYEGLMPLVDARR